MERQGHTSRTDVLELLLQDPLTGHWLSTDGFGPAIATTIALSLRETIAERLGIDSDEVGFSQRIEKDPESGHNRCVAQVYDMATGGAGAQSGSSIDIA